MKKLNILFAILMLAFVAVSCETYDDVPSESEYVTVIGFTTGESSITFNPGQTEKSTTVNLFISESADVDRTFTLSVLESEVGEENYTFDPEIVIPAGEKQTTFTFTAFNVSLSEEEQKVVLAIDATNGLVSGQSMTILLKKRV